MFEASLRCTVSPWVGTSDLPTSPSPQFNGGSEDLESLVMPDPQSPHVLGRGLDGQEQCWEGEEPKLV